ncbi:tyrosine-type recombinase/integrase [Nevskia sp.]|uniref:tyrosine-type recombinase/integrase n=1 Tax=Nevskia sp. TaxID=1929292 RepID=UPI0025EA8693|nr:tyrosine-type recombinase/integrase [Nevskia sp.]
MAHPQPDIENGFSRHRAVAELLAQTPDGAVDRLRAMADDLKIAYAPNTLKSWRADWRVWLKFCADNSHTPLPASLPTLRAFVLERIAAGRKRATIEHYLATLTVVHRLAELPSPMDSMEARLMWRGLRREHLSARQRQAKGLTLDDVDTIVTSLDPGIPRDIRDAALISTAFETMFRRSELVVLRIEDLSEEADGSGRIFLPSSKTDQDAAGFLQYLSPDTLVLIKAWLAIAGLADGPIFRSTPKSNQPDRYANPLSDRDVARIFKQRALRAGLDAELISGHSTRVGAAQDLIAANFSGAEVMRQGRWKTERMVIRYSESLSAGRGAMARLKKFRKPPKD